VHFHISHDQQPQQRIIPALAGDPLPITFSHHPKQNKNFSGTTVRDLQIAMPRMRES
jgi:hypothetical protein